MACGRGCVIIGAGHGRGNEPLMGQRRDRWIGKPSLFTFGQKRSLREQEVCLLVWGRGGESTKQTLFDRIRSNGRMIWKFQHEVSFFSLARCFIGEKYEMSVSEGCLSGHVPGAVLRWDGLASHLRTAGGACRRAPRYLPLSSRRLPAATHGEHPPVPPPINLAPIPEQVDEWACHRTLSRPAASPSLSRCVPTPPAACPASPVGFPRRCEAQRRSRRSGRCHCSGQTVRF